MSSSSTKVKSHNQQVLEAIYQSLVNKAKNLMITEPMQHNVNTLTPKPCEFMLIPFQPEIKNLLFYTQQVYNNYSQFKIVNKLNHIVLFEGNTKEVPNYLYSLLEEGSITDKEYKILINFFITYERD